MNVFKREWKANRKALIIWCACIVLGVLSGMGKYTAYSAGGASGDIFNSMPHTLKALLGMGSFDVTTMSGYFALLFLYLELMVAIHAALLGSGIIAKEERDKTTEFLMIKPVSRHSIITAKLLAALLNAVILNVVSLVCSIVTVSAYNTGNDITLEIIMFHVSMLFVQLIFLSLGALLSALMRDPKPSGSLAAGILLGSFAISKVTDLINHTDFLNVLSPFKYFNYADIVKGNGLNVTVVLLSILLVAVCSVGTYYFYQKRDLKI